MSTNELFKSLEKIGLPRDFSERMMRDPIQLAAIMQGLGIADMTHDAGPSPEDEGDMYLQQIKHLKDTNARERLLQPEKIPPLPRSSVIAEITQWRSQAALEYKNPNGIVRQTTIGMSQSSSQKDINDLKRTNLSEMFVRKTHRGKYFLCRIISKTTRVVAVSFAAEDPEGNATKVAVYNYPCTLDAPMSETDLLFPIGSIIAIREPTYKLTINGAVPMIRVDSPSDIVFVDSNWLQNIIWKSGAIHNSLLTLKTAEEWRARGAREFKAGSFLCAAISFSEGLILDPDHSILRLNRSEAYIRLGWFNSALKDSEITLQAGLIDDSLIRKAVFRAAKASYNKHDYVRAIEIAGLLPKDDDCKEWISKSNKRLHEAASGEYDWCTLFREGQLRTPRVYVADFRGPVEVREVLDMPGVRGVFVTRDVKIGELLMVSRPFISCYLEDNPFHDREKFISLNLLTNTMCSRSRADIVPRLIQKMWDDPKLAITIQNMYSGPDTVAPTSYPANPSPASTLSHPRRPSVDFDIERIEGVASFNAFSLESLGIEAIKRPVTATSKEVDKGTGLYELPSFCNHACLASAHRVLFGDVMVVRASRALAKGEEVTLEYISGSNSLKERGGLSRWGFNCNCLMCKADHVDGLDACSSRTQLVKDPSLRTVTIKQAEKIVSRVKSTYRDSEERLRCRTRPDLFLAYHILGHAIGRLARSDLSYCKAAIEAEMDSLVAIGIVITDRSTSGRVVRKKNLPVDVNHCPTHRVDDCIMVVIQIVATFDAMRERRRAQDWLKVAAWIADIYTGGGKELFLLRFSSVFEELGMIKLVQDVF